MTDDTTTPVQGDDAVVRPFADFLVEHARGRTHGELSDKLHELVAAVTDTGKAGSLQLTIKIAPMKKTAGDMLTVSDVVKMTKPQHDRKESIFYVGDDGNLSRTDPNQAQLPLHKPIRAAGTPSTTEQKENRA